MQLVDPVEDDPGVARRVALLVEHLARLGVGVPASARRSRHSA